MKKIKRILALVLAVIFVVGMLTACGGGKDKQGGGKDDGKIHIGLMHFTWTSRISTSLLDYCNNYLAPNFNVEFTTYTCGFDNDSCISTVENMITAGEDGLILLVSSGITEIDKICHENGVPFALIQGKPTDAEEAKLMENASEEFICCIAPSENPADGGIIEAEAMLAQGLTKCAIVSTPMGMIEAGDQEDAGFIKAFTEGGGTIVDEKREIPGDPMITAADTVIATHGDEIDFLYGLLDVLQSIVTDPKYAEKNLKIVSNELPSDGGVALFEKGILAFCLEKDPQQVGLALAGIINYLNGDQYKDAPAYRKVISPYTQIHNAEECKMFLKVADGKEGCDPLWNVDEIKSLILAENPSATFADFCKLAASTQVDEICERHGITK